jgi:hypothetical protein
MDTEVSPGPSPRTGKGIPEVDDRISAARGNTGAVGRPGHAKSPVSIGCARRHRIAADEVPGRGVPYLHRFSLLLVTVITGRRGDARPAR